MFPIGLFSSSRGASRTKAVDPPTERTDAQGPAERSTLSPAAQKAARAESVSKWGVISSLAGFAAGLGLVVAGVMTTSVVAPALFAVGGVAAVGSFAAALTFAGYGGGGNSSDSTTTALAVMSMANSINTLNNLNH